MAISGLRCDCVRGDSPRLRVLRGLPDQGWMFLWLVGLAQPCKWDIDCLPADSLDTNPARRGCHYAGPRHRRFLLLEVHPDPLSLAGGLWTTAGIHTCWCWDEVANTLSARDRHPAAPSIATPALRSGAGREGADTADSTAVRYPCATPSQDGLFGARRSAHQGLQTRKSFHEYHKRRDPHAHPNQVEGLPRG